MDFFNEEKIHIYLSYVIVLLCIILILITFFFVTKVKRLIPTNEDVSSEIVEEEKEQSVAKEIIEVNEVKEKIKVDIKGAVKTPGVYEVDNGAVVQDVISLAGGLKGNGSTQFINLAFKVKDQMVIRILTTNELKELDQKEKEPCICDTIDTSSCKEDVIIVPNDKETNDASKKEETNKTENTTNNGKDEGEKKDTLVSINTASIKELTTIPGVGEAKAKAIVAYREQNGLFQSIEDIKKVSGIGEALYKKIKDYIKL